MGVNYGQRRQRMSDMQNPGEVTETSIGVKDLDMSHWDEQLIHDHINAKIDIQEDKLKEKTQKFVR